MNIKAIKNKTLVEGKDIYALSDMSKKELAKIGERLEQKIAAANGSTSFFAEDKSDDDTKEQLEIVKEIYLDKVASAKNQEQIRQFEEDTEFAKRALQAQRMKAIENMSPEQIEKLIKDNTAKIAKLKE